MVDVLSFVDVRLEGIERYHSRQLAINGVLLHSLVNSHEEPFKDLAAPIVDGWPNDDFFDALLTGSTGESLPARRFALAFCSHCLNSDGWLMTAEFEQTRDRVTWSGFGLSNDMGVGADKQANQTSFEPKTGGWTTELFRPPARFTFDRAEYEASIEAERARSRSLGRKP